MRTVRPVYIGVLKACKCAVTENRRSFDASYLYKGRKDEVELCVAISKAREALEYTYPEAHFTFEHQKINGIVSGITVVISGDPTKQYNRFEAWLEKICTTRPKSITFAEIARFYNQEPKWARAGNGFIDYIKKTMIKVKEAISALCSFKIKKSDKEVALWYA